MRNRSLYLGAALVILLSGFIAHAAVYWTPWFGARLDYGVGSFFKSDVMYPEYIDTFSPYDDVIGVWSIPARHVRELAKLQPEQFQATVESLFNNLIKLPEPELYMLSAAADDVCLSPLIDCQGVPGKNVRPFVEKALAHRQSRETIAISAGSLDTARLSLAVAFAAFLVSVLGLFVKRKA